MKLKLKQLGLFDRSLSKISTETEVQHLLRRYMIDVDAYSTKLHGTTITLESSEREKMSTVA